MTHFQHRIRVWDAPTRLFHWALVACVAGAYASVKAGGLWMDWHVRFGTVTFGLILFRLLWGFVGPHYARFAQFVRGPRAIWQQLQGHVSGHAGHSPLGALSVIAMLTLLAFQTITGLFANDDIFTSGPLAYISSDWSAQLTRLHKLSEWPLIILLGTHIAAILWYRAVRQNDLITPMVTGNATLSGTHPAPRTRDDWVVWLTALAIAVAVAALIMWIYSLAPANDSFY